MKMSFSTLESRSVCVFVSFIWFGTWSLTNAKEYWINKRET